ncbi:MAG: universal stress protein UspA [Anaeromicrobium sp.]|jgi:K+-sensing histidine kinase KdpD|uniref:universal stress protein UspA n=1 Tax=Anaeromicrobium sp. TaxID=1929132 RepID=UPI0025FF4FF4|nr:universal stress protein UspA [Anaeromicrobium sp.]MCT4595998.1 universal stress protein UspA [Anaeromicrobium sp.]
MNTIKNIMVCVTQQKTCKRLIKKGVKIRDEHDGDLFVIHVAKEGCHFLNKEEDGDALEFLFDVAKSHGASLTVVRAQDVLGTLRDLAVKNEIDLIVLGESYENKQEKNMVNMLEDSLPDGIGIEIVPVAS